MADVHVCPLCGAPRPFEVTPPGEESRPQSQYIAEERARPTELLASGSDDQTFLPHAPRSSLATEPDSYLEALATAPLDDPRGVPSSGRPSSTSTQFPALDLGGTAIKSPETDEDMEEEAGQGTTWGYILLGSYASAITLALVWNLWFKPRDREDSLDDHPSATPTTAGRQAELSREVAPPEPVMAKHRVGLKTPLVVGSLEVTPLEVRRGKVRLRRTSLDGRVERREGGENALILRLKLRNLSDDKIFAPLDQAFLREQQKVLVDTFLETGDGQRVYPYPLAIESEWSIVDQDFTPLKPHEARVVSIVSAPDAPEDNAGPFTWRTRLRSGPGRTDVIEVSWPQPQDEPSKK